MFIGRYGWFGLGGLSTDDDSDHESMAELEKIVTNDANASFAVVATVANPPPECSWYLVGLPVHLVKSKKPMVQSDAHIPIQKLLVPSTFGRPEAIAFPSPHPPSLLQSQTTS